MLLGRLHSFPVRIGFAGGTDDPELSHDPVDALEIHDDIEMTSKCHLDLLCAFLSILEVKRKGSGRGRRKE